MKPKKIQIQKIEESFIISFEFSLKQKIKNLFKGDISVALDESQTKILEIALKK
jgi:hypothetical protein